MTTPLLYAMAAGALFVLGEWFADLWYYRRGGRRDQVVQAAVQALLAQPAHARPETVLVVQRRAA